MGKYYDNELSRKLTGYIKNNPYLAKERYEDYLSKYPLDYNAWSCYINVLIILHQFELAEERLNYLENVVFADKRYVSDPKIMHLKKKEILFCRIKILNHTKRFDDLYRLIRADQNKYFLLEFGFFRLLDVYCRKRLGKFIDIERAEKSYLFHQIADYSFDRMISHVKEHLSDYNSLLDIPENSIFSDDFPLKDILSQFKDYVGYDKKLCYGIIDDVYIFKYDNCGKVNYKTTDFFKVICFSGTCDIITAYPIDNVKHLPYTDLSSFVKNDDDIQMIMRPSARDRFNKRFNRK